MLVSIFGCLLEDDTVRDVVNTIIDVSPVSAADRRDDSLGTQGPAVANLPCPWRRLVALGAPFMPRRHNQNRTSSVLGELV